MAENKDIDKLELPRFWQVLQLWSIQSLAGSIVVLVGLTRDTVSKTMIEAFGAKAYAIFLGIWIVIGAVSAWGAGMKGFTLLIQIIRETKSSKND